MRGGLDVPDAPSGRFRDRTAVVTGAASGIGAATAYRLAAEGAAVVLADLDSRGETIAKDIRTTHAAAAQFVRLDVADETGWADLAGRVGGIDLLVSNAAAVDVRPALDTTRESWDRQLAVCLTATFLGARAFLPELRRRGGSIVVTSSVQSLVGIPGHPAYAAAKGGLNGLVRQLAVDYGPEVRVNAILPGPVVTGMWDRVPAQDRELSAEATALRRLGQPEEVAAAIAFLGSDDASFITGSTLLVDGGWSITKASA
jgi:glucose 1-dehydrogenase